MVVQVPPGLGSWRKSHPLAGPGLTPARASSWGELVQLSVKPGVWGEGMKNGLTWVTFPLSACRRQQGGCVLPKFMITN